MSLTTPLGSTNGHNNFEILVDNMSYYKYYKNNKNNSKFNIDSTMHLNDVAILIYEQGDD